MTESGAWYNVIGWTVDDLVKGKNPSLCETRIPENDFFGAQQKAKDFVVIEGVGSFSQVERIEPTDGRVTPSSISVIQHFCGEEYAE